jgi:hypothetical protein
MPNETPGRSKPIPRPDLKASLLDAWEIILDLEETVNELILRQSALLIALATTVPDFAREYDLAYSAGRIEQEKQESKLTPSVREALRQLRKEQT